jgi:hypothetical protein
MKKFIPLILVWLVTLIFTGCYTHIAVDDSYTYSDPTPIIIIEPAPPPVVIIHPIIGGPHPHPPTRPVKKPEYKTRPIKRPHTGDLRRPGNTRNPVTPPPSKDRIKDESRNPGGSNDGRRKSRR